MQRIRPNTKHSPGSTIYAFLKKSLFFAFLYSTMLYIAIRLFFYEFPFTFREGFELHSNILLVVWIFTIACKLAFTGIVLVEKNINKMEFDHFILVPFLKKAMFIMLTAVLSYTGKSGATDDSGKIASSGNNPLTNQN